MNDLSIKSKSAPRNTGEHFNGSESSGGSTRIGSILWDGTFPHFAGNPAAWIPENQLDSNRRLFSQNVDKFERMMNASISSNKQGKGIPIKFQIYVTTLCIEHYTI